MFQNHFLYRKAEDGKWCVFPWDMDNTLGGAFGEATAHPFRGADESRIGPVGNREGWWNRLKDSFFIAYPDEFQAMFHYLNNHVYSPAQMRPVVETMATERGYGSGTVNSLMSHIQRRHDYLNATLVPPVVTPALTVRRAGPDTLECSWPFAAFGFRLQSAPQLRGPWQPVPEPVATGPDTQAVKLRLQGPQRYFRLVR
ncbi:MAG: CotH kinase family protein [Verrucomicrobiales bacterium]|nr:CotH kinase family protein [Verrucomicrobiales bacterium]